MKKIVPPQTRDINDILPKEFLEERKLLSEQTPSNSSYWNILGELMFFGGFDAVQAVLDDYIDLDQADELLKGARKAHYKSVYENGVASLAAHRGLHKVEAFNSTMSPFLKEIQ